MFIPFKVAERPSTKAGRGGCVTPVVIASVPPV